LTDVFIRLAAAGPAETCGSCRRTARARGSGDELEQIESDIFIAAGAKTRGIESVHTDKSPKRDATRCAPAVAALQLTN
jgi:predicted nucleic acid-binding protein